MKHFITLTASLLAFAVASAQVFYSNGATVTVTTGGSLSVSGNAQFQSGSSLTNDGMLNVSGNVTNNASMSVANTGTLHLNGTAAQTLSGSGTYFAKNVVLNNAAGITLNMPLKVDGVFNFTNGIMTAATTGNAVTFTTNASISGTNMAKDASHIAGYVVREGTGIFTYPVGDGTKYQGVAINLTANATGLRVKYNAADAGSGSFTTTGTEAAALVSYNKNEHWDITPLSTASGTVTLYWDGYKDGYPNALTYRRVAHKSGGSWLNEGGNATGTVSSGSVTSNAVSTWSPFALGTVSSPLPLKWLSVNATIANGFAQLTWQVEEKSVLNYAVEKSKDGRIFSVVANIISKGDGIHAYSFAEAVPLQGTAYYRIRQTDRDGRESYSTIMHLSKAVAGNLSFYPNPFSAMVTVNSAIAQTVGVMDALGRVVQTVTLTPGTHAVNMGKLSKGIYTLQTTNGEVLKLVKE